MIRTQRPIRPGAIGAATLTALGALLLRDLVVPR